MELEGEAVLPIKLLLTADIHYRLDWMEWLSKSDADFTFVAGDLLNNLDPNGDVPQMIAIANWCRSFPSNLALCSGNHDTPDPTLPIPQLSASQIEVLRELRQMHNWMDALSRPSVVTDGHSGVLGTRKNSIVVTTIPFHADAELAEVLWQQGAALREKWGAPWIVLNHEPPACTWVGGSHGNHDIFNKLLCYSPTYLLGGHIHNIPYEGGFASKVASSWCFNAGYPPSTKAISASFPNHIVIYKGRATWRATGLDGFIQQSIELT